MAAKQVRIGLVGYQFMGKAHSNAYRQIQRFFPEIGIEPVLTALCGRTEAKVKAAAEKFGFASYETDYEKLVARDDIDLIDIVTPGDTHVPSPSRRQRPERWSSARSRWRPPSPSPGR